MIRQCDFCSHEFEDYNKLGINNLVYCSIQCESDQYGRDAYRYKSIDQDEDLYLFNRRNNPNE